MDILGIFLANICAYFFSLQNITDKSFHALTFKLSSYWSVIDIDADKKIKGYEVGWFCRLGDVQILNVQYLVFSEENLPRM